MNLWLRGETEVLNKITELKAFSFFLKFSQKLFMKKVWHKNKVHMLIICN